jgi:hypothetical protein
MRVQTSFNNDAQLWHSVYHTSKSKPVTDGQTNQPVDIIFNFEQ